MIQFPRGWNRWRFWLSGGIDDYGWRYTSLLLRRSPRHPAFEIQWGRHEDVE